MEVPRCPDPAHAGGRVVRAGWYGRPPRRRQRWLCRPTGGHPHRFTELLPRRETDRSMCRSCFTQLEPWEGQPGPRTYSFTAMEIAHLLARVAAGDTCMTSRRRDSQPVMDDLLRWGAPRRGFARRADGATLVCAARLAHGAGNHDGARSPCVVRELAREDAQEAGVSRRVVLRRCGDSRRASCAHRSGDLGSGPSAEAWGLRRAAARRRRCCGAWPAAAAAGVRWAARSS
jgi:hypothetical protein